MSVRSLGVLACVALAGAGVAAVIGFQGAALALLSFALLLYLGVVQRVERRRHATQRKLMRSIDALSTLVIQQRFGLEAEHDQHTKSLGLVFRELRGISEDVAGQESLLSEQSERQLATYLLALRAQQQELADAIDIRRKAADAVDER